MDPDPLPVGLRIGLGQTGTMPTGAGIEMLHAPALVLEVGIVIVIVGGLETAGGRGHGLAPTVAGGREGRGGGVGTPLLPSHPRPCGPFHLVLRDRVERTSTDRYRLFPRVRRIALCRLEILHRSRREFRIWFPRLRSRKTRPELLERLSPALPLVAVAGLRRSPRHW